MTVVFSLLLCLAGGAIYFIAANPKFQELGRIMFFCGLFTLAQQLAGHQLTFLK